MPIVCKVLIDRPVYIVIVFLILLSGCATTEQSSSASSQQLIYGLTTQPDGLDPHIHRSVELGIPLRQVYDTLVYRDPFTKEFVPGLASSWSISSDGLTYTFNLRDDVTFHDGTPFNAQAVAANLDRIVADETRSLRAASMLGPYVGHRVIDNTTIQIVLSEPFSPLLDSLSQVYLGIVSPTALAEFSRNRYQFHQVGTGPYQFIEYVPGDRIVLERNPSYTWGPSFYQNLPGSAPERIEFRFVDELEVGELLIESKLNIGEATLSDTLELMISRGQLQRVPVAIPGQPIQFFFNTQRFPTDSRAIRQGLLFSANRNAIIDAAFETPTSIAWGPISSSTLFYNPEVIGVYAHDTTQALTLFESQGFQDTNNDGILEFGGIDIELKIIILTIDPLPEIVDVLAEQWQTVGIKTSIEAVPTFTALVERLQVDDYNLVAFHTSGLDPFFLNQFFSSSGRYNWTNFADPELDNLLSEASRQTDPVIRQALYRQIQRKIMEEALILPIAEVSRSSVVTQNVRNLVYDPYGWFPLLMMTSLGEE